MRKMKRIGGLWALSGAAAGVLMLVGVASAQPRYISTEQSGSIVVWPNVVWDGVRDTVIQLTNTHNRMVHAHCFYVNAAPVNPQLPPSITNPPQWVETDFWVWLTRQQPTHWVASLGRRVDFNDPFGSDGAGLDVGLVPPVPLGFTGELKCVQVDDGGAPLRANSLKGEATLIWPDGDITQYNAIALAGNPEDQVGSGDQTLTLDRTPQNLGGEYNSCPNVLILNHFADGAPDMVLDQEGECDPVCIGGTEEGTPCEVDTDCAGAGRCLACPVSTSITLVPCQEDFENQIPGRVTVQFQIFNEFEQPFSTSTTVDCWLDSPISLLGTPGAANPFTYRVLGTLGAVTRITPNPGNGGVIGVAQEMRRDTYAASPTAGVVGPATRAAYNIHIEGTRFSNAGVTDRIILPSVE